MASRDPHPCIFCRIVAGEAPAYVVDEDETTLAFLDRGAATRGHTLVVPKKHARDIWDLPQQAAAGVMVAATRVAHRLRQTLAPDGLGLFQANGEAGWQEVFHFHLHVVPRYVGDPLVLPWQGTHPTDAELSEVLRTVSASGQVSED